jgi:cytochrome c
MRWRIGSLLTVVLVLFWTSSFADREAGRDVFFSAGCIACHAIGCNKAGPKLERLIGRRAGTVPDFDGYSDVMKTSAVVWTDETIDAYLANPASFMPGNGMAGSAGNLEDAVQRRDLIDFLKEPDNSQDLCF